MKILYRISNAGNTKIKPAFVNPINVFKHFITIFKDFEIFVVADNISDETHAFLLEHVASDHLFRTSLNNAGAFMYSVMFAINHFDDKEKVYFAEDDYIYIMHAPKILLEGLCIADYVSGYDHPDKYINVKDGGPNPFIMNGGELTRVILSPSSHWKQTNSCCMTFATTVAILKQDLEVYKKYCKTKHPYDFMMFQELINLRKRTLISPIPSVSTHGETQWLAKFVDWEKEISIT